MNQNTIDLTESKILIVDDHLPNVDLLRKTLESKGYRISLAPSGEVALQLVARVKPDLILLDVQMPGINGFETCRRLKGDESVKDIPVLFITSYNETERIVEGFEAGGVDYIVKPFQPKEVLVRVETHLTNKRLRDGLQEAYTRLEIDNARKTEELETARKIQLGFLPGSTPELPGLEIAHFQKPTTEVGGDYYDFFLAPPEGLKPCEGWEPSQGSPKLLVAIGDATGHGVGASLMVSATKTALMTVKAPDLTKRVSEINTILKHVNSSRRLNMGLVLIELSVDASTNTVWAKATGGGMPPLYMLRSNGKVEEFTITGLPLGAMETAKYTSAEFRLEKSDALILMSDGLPERLNGDDEMLGAARLMAEIAEIGKVEPNANGILKVLVKLGDEWAENTPQSDDVTLVVLKVK